jgi:hypothetical protein
MVFDHSLKHVLGRLFTGNAVVQARYNYLARLELLDAQRCNDIANCLAIRIQSRDLFHFDILKSQHRNG